MSSEVVMAGPILGGIALIATAPIILPVIAAGAAIAVGGAASVVAGYGAVGVGKFAYKHGSELYKSYEKEKQARERKLERKRQEEIAAISSKLDNFLSNAVGNAEGNFNTADFYQKNREFIFENLIDDPEGSGKLDISKYSPTKPDSPVAPAHQEEDYAEKIKELHAKLSILDSRAAADQSGFMAEVFANCSKARMQVIYDNLRFAFGSALREQTRNIWSKAKLKEMLNTLSEKRQSDFANEIARLEDFEHTISEAEFNDAATKYAEYLTEELRLKQNAILEEQTIVQMRSLGYTPVTNSQEQHHGAYYFYTPDPEYRIMARVNPQNGQLSFRFVRVVGTEREKAAYTTEQKRRDREKAKKWCEKSRLLAEMISESTGIPLEEIFRKEPDENEEILVVVDSSFVDKRASGMERNEVLNSANI